MPMPEEPKRAFAAPSSLQRSKFTLAPVVVVGILVRGSSSAWWIKGGKGKKDKRIIGGVRTCVVGVLQSFLAALGFGGGFVSIIRLLKGRHHKWFTYNPLITRRGAEIVDFDHNRVQASHLCVGIGSVGV